MPNINEKREMSMNTNDILLDTFHLEEGLKQHPDKVVLIDGEKKYTYAEFLSQAISYGKELAARKVRNQAIGILAEHCAETVIMQLGILLSGNYYIALQTECTKERLQEICRIADIKVMAGLAEQIEGMEDYLPVQVLPCRAYTLQENLDGELDYLKKYREGMDDNPVLYGIFTSGSTGKPKGILKTHNAMHSFLETYIEEFEISCDEKIASQTPFYFDASAKDIYLLFRLHCTMYIVPKEMFMMPLKLAEYMDKSGITMLQWVPSALMMMSKLKIFEKGVPSAIRKVFFVGEVFPVEQLKIWMNYFPETEFVNLYGFSEIAGICAFYRVNRETLEDKLPVGYALGNCRLHLMNEEQKLNHLGQKGELVVESEALAKVYLNATDSRKDAFFEYNGKQYYRTGDLMEYDEKGALYYVNRQDFQVKHMGYRIELGEIEEKVGQMSSVTQAVCTYTNGKIHLYYEGNIAVKELIGELKKRLPSYMIPNRVRQVEAFPLNSNGKIDRRRLQEWTTNK